MLKYHDNEVIKKNNRSNNTNFRIVDSKKSTAMIKFKMGFKVTVLRLFAKIAIKDANAFNAL